MNIFENEKAKYQDAWLLPGYSKNSPGAKYVDLFMEISGAKEGESLIDFGAGSGAASRKLKDKGLSVVAFDLVDTAWKHEDIKLIVGSLWNSPPTGTPHRFGYCCDVMEHIPTEFVALVVSNMLARCTNIFLSVSFEDDVFGHFVGQPLHLTVKPFNWWLDMFREVATVHEARDILGEGIFYLGRKQS